MVFVKVRETYDLHTVKNKMTVIAIHTPKPDIIKANFPGLLMQCKSYRPVSADVRIACASVLPMDPLGIGLEEGSVAPEDMFNPILYKACSNFGMSQIEARISALSQGSIVGADVVGNTAEVDVDTTTGFDDEFPIYYGFLSNAHEWRHANPQSGLEMHGLKPLVYELLYNIGDNSTSANNPGNNGVAYPGKDGSKGSFSSLGIRGNAKPLPFLNCTSYTGSATPAQAGFQASGDTQVLPLNNERDVPYVNCCVGAIIVPPSRLHELFYRMVVEWVIEFSQIRPLSEITDWNGLSKMASLTHYQNYDYSSTKMAVTGSEETILEKDTCMVSANVDVNKVM